MSQYTHRITLAVPESLMSQANQLALIVGEFPSDINTFAYAGWQDKDGNKYAACSAVVKPVVLSLYQSKLSELGLPQFKQEANIEQAQQAMDKVVMYKQGDKVSTTKIMCAIDFEPLQAFADMGLTIVETDEV